MIISDLIAKRREKRLSQADLAQRMCVATSQIQKWEANERAPRTDTLTMWAEALGCALALVETSGKRDNE